ncbi:uridine permease [Scheffersomyces coipomensis]|uniref:uridine permease n=1 Tax=Scheffersomyces coipomensis TaxID=1788519 RepID=UPI00315DBF20
MSEVETKKQQGIILEEEEINQDSSSSLENNQGGEVSLWRRFLNIVELEEPKGLTASQMFLYNYDLRPVETARRQWSWYNYVFFWVADSFNINTWQIAATGIQQGGMNWWQTWLSVWVGYALCGIFVSIGARTGIMYHISFPIVTRSSFGLFGSLWPIFNRVFMSAVWYGVQTSVAAPCVSVMLRSIFGKNLDVTMPNHISDPTITTFGFLSLFLFWLFSLPFLWFPPHKIRHLFTFKAYVTPVAGIGFLVWALVKAGGVGPVIHQKSTVEGNELAWAFIESTMNSLANFATLIVNAPDYARFSNTGSFGMKYLVYTLSIPFCFSLTSLIGILVTSAAQVIYDEAYWSPLDVLGRFLDDYTSGNRAGVFFIGLAFAIAQLGTNISANSLSFGTDVSALLPRFLNIRRGSYICAALALCICPWRLTTSSSKFTTYLSAYSVFLSSIAGVIACDYFYIRRGYLKLTHLYSLFRPEDPSQDSLYRYNKLGINWRAYVAYIAGILPNIVGFVGATGTHNVSLGATEIYRLNFFMGFFSAWIVYAVLNYISPVETGMPALKPFEKGWYEELQDVDDFEAELQGQVVHGIDSDNYEAHSTGFEDKKSFV